MEDLIDFRWKIQNTSTGFNDEHITTPTDSSDQQYFRKNMSKPTDYHGSEFFLEQSASLELTVDVVNIVACLLVALCMATLMYMYLPPKNKNFVFGRKLFGVVIGLSMVYFCFGNQIIHLIILPFICFVAIKTLSPNVIHKAVLFICFFYLSWLHIDRQYHNYGSSTLDITGPIMIMVQKLTTLAYGLHDDLTADKNKLTDIQKHFLIRNPPTLIDYVSYLLTFHTIAGPNVSFEDYMAYLDGSNFPKILPKHAKSQPSPLIPVLQKIVIVLLCAYTIYYVKPLYPASMLRDRISCPKTPMIPRISSILVLTNLARFKYYFLWIFIDAVCNASGFGFTGYNENGDQNWNLLENVDILAVEFGLNFRISTDAWNKSKNLWLRYVMYERVSPKYNIVLTYLMSALWHGFYPDYYITFLTGALFTISARMVRKCFWHFFQWHFIVQMLYNLLTSLVTRLCLSYMTFSFIYLELTFSANVFRCLHFYLHISAVLVWSVLKLYTVFFGLPRRINVILSNNNEQ